MVFQLALIDLVGTIVARHHLRRRRFYLFKHSAVLSAESTACLQNAARPEKLCKDADTVISSCDRCRLESVPVFCEKQSFLGQASYSTARPDRPNSPQEREQDEGIAIKKKLEQGIRRNVTFGSVAGDSH